MPKPSTMVNKPKYHLSRLADNDLLNIAEYTIQEFGIKQARQYRDALENCFLTLAENPNMGRKADELATGLKRFEHQSHIVFYLKDNEDLFIVRVLHNRVDVIRHF